MKRMGGSEGPRPLAGALSAVRGDVAPRTLLAAVQEAWPRVAGPAAAAQAEPVSERAGTVTVACRSATWAQELDFMQDELLARLRSELADGAFADGLDRLRFSADAARADPA